MTSAKDNVKLVAMFSIVRKRTFPLVFRPSQEKISPATQKVLLPKFDSFKLLFTILFQNIQTKKNIPPALLSFFSNHTTLLRPPQEKKNNPV